MLVWPLPSVFRHAVIFGGSGSGKTETALRMGYEVARETDAQVFYLDAKGSRGNAERFRFLMQEAGRSTRIFPNEPFDAWRGDWRAIVNRLLEVVSFTREGPASYYRDIAKRALRLACHHPDGPPRSSRELLERLTLDHLERIHRTDPALETLTSEKVAEVAGRFEAFFGQQGCALDGDWSWEDPDAGYVLLDSVSLGEDATSTASMVFTDFAHYFKERKDPDRMCLLIIDEFSAIASCTDIATKVEQAREFKAALIMVPQTPWGMGGQEQRERILGSVETVVSHASNEPDEIASLAGSVKALEFSHRYDVAGDDGSGLARLVDQPRLDGSRIRRLDVGEAWLIRRGKAAKLAVQRAPEGMASLPDQTPLDKPLERRKVVTSRDLSVVFGDDDSGKGSGESDDS